MNASHHCDDVDVVDQMPIESAKKNIVQQHQQQSIDSKDRDAQMDEIMMKIFKDRRIYRRDCDRSPLYANENFDKPWTLVSR